MFNVSDDFLNALRFTHQVFARVTVTDLDGTVVTLGVQSGTITATYQQATRRTADITVYATGTKSDGSTVNASSMNVMLTRPGTVCLVEMGIGSNLVAQTMIPMMMGAPSNVAWRIGDGEIDFDVNDDWWRVSQGRFTTIWSPNAGLKRVDAVSAIMQAVAPSRQLIVTATDTGTIQSQGDWDVNRDTAVETLATDGGFDAYFDRQGRITLADSKTADDPVVWSVTAGDGGMLVNAETGMDASRLYNAVVVKPSATDNSQTWTAQTAVLTSGDRAPANLGVTIPYFMASPTISSAAAALAAAQNQLNRVTGTPMTIQADMLSNPALDEGDVIEILLPANPNEGIDETMYRYYIDTITWDLITGGMSVKARNEGEVSDDAS
ncbi:hypothetical protein [Bifidobacterium aquikefiri]|uniref:hypothetical protein n=1 Tax=Bifidobacterium aquikefiri TaxID=1653207 RepID=UPI0039EBF243